MDMRTYDTRQYVEMFHLLFLDMMGRKIDKRYYALKGGCNLRFYLKSFRYSEDMDIDVQAVPKEKLEDTVQGIFKSTPFLNILKSKGMVLDKWSAPKQTETTQRWKVSIAVENMSIALNTKIEFSRRGIRKGLAFEAVDPELIRQYSLTPIMANHYDMNSACEQKTEALITRKITQARDIFDLNLLLNSGAKFEFGSNGRVKERIGEAVSNARSVKFDIFKAQVLSFLPLEYQVQYDSESVWDDMVLHVVEALGKEAP